MRYTFLSAYRVQGIAHTVSEADVTLFENKAKGIRVLLTNDVTKHLHLLNRHLALLTMMMQGTIGNPVSIEFPELLISETAKIEQQRLDAIGSDPVIIIEINGEVDAQIPLTARTIQNFILCFDAFDKKALKVRLQSEISAILTALRIGSGEPLEFRQVCDGSYLHTDTNQVVHSATFEAGNMSMYVSKRLTQEQHTQVAADVALALKAGSLGRVMRLHAQSLSNTTDNYRAFIAAWSALEILIGKLFPIYQQLLAAELRNINQSPGLHSYLDRVANVMNGKYKLSDKFAVLSVYLDNSNVPNEVQIFRDLKEIRDQLSHGQEIEEAALPTKDVHRLFDKYLRNHLRRVS